MKLASAFSQRPLWPYLPKLHEHHPLLLLSIDSAIIGLSLYNCLLYLLDKRKDIGNHHHGGY